MSNFWTPVIQGSRDTLAAPSEILRAWALGIDSDEPVAGEIVNESTAMGIAAYFACIRNISEDIAKLPWNVYTRRNGRMVGATHYPTITWFRCYRAR